MDLEECFKNLKENKVTKDNVWQNHFIDDFKDSIAAHHKKLGNFPLVGSMLEASSQIYGMKVDTVHADVLRMGNGLRRQTILETINDSVEDSIVSETTPVVAPKKVTRNKRRATTIIGNKELINAPLQLIEEPNPMFASFSSSSGMGLSTKNLLQNVLPSYRSALSLNAKTEFWNNQDAPVNEMVDPADSDVACVECVELPTSNWEPTGNDVVRPKLTRYEISNTPHENNWNSAIIDNHVEMMDTSELIEIAHSSISSIDYQFNIDADVEPMESSNIRLHSDIGGISMDNFTEDDQNALARCSGLRRQGINVNDLRPCNESGPSEYSYRRLEVGNNQFWAGPSYWKVPSAIQRVNRSRRVRRRKKPIAPRKLLAVINANIDRQFVSLHGGNISTRSVCVAKWDKKKLKLPDDLKYEMNRFSFLSLAPAAFIDAEHYAEDYALDANDSDDFNSYLNAFGGGDDLRDERENINADVVNIFESNTDININMSVEDDGVVMNSSIQDIDMNVEGEDQFEQLNIPNINSQRNIDMKQLRVIGLRIIRNGALSFSSVYGEFQKIFVNEVITPSVVLATILELANENDFYLNKIDGKNDFLIEHNKKN